MTHIVTITLQTYLKQFMFA